VLFRTVIRGSMFAMVAAVVAACLPAGAWAHEGAFARFNDCPSTTEGVWKCLYSVTSGGKVVLGNKSTPIVNPVILQGGYSEENEETGFSRFYGATNDETLSKTAQPVPGGLVGLVPPESAPLLVKIALTLALDNGFTGVNATLELAKPASDIELSTFSLLAKFGTALKLPVKVHLENPLLGSSCYVGSESSPVIWNLTTGKTSPPAPYESITGKAGTPVISEHEELVELTENKLVDNTWEAPAATGCGGALEALVDPIINSSLVAGLPAEAGKNEAILENTISTATVGSVNSH
jgi:hypothetical protein